MIKSSIIAKGYNYRFPATIDFQECRENIAASLNMKIVIVGVSESMWSKML